MSVLLAPLAEGKEARQEEFDRVFSTYASSSAGWSSRGGGCLCWCRSRGSAGEISLSRLPPTSSVTVQDAALKPFISKSSSSHGKQRINDLHIHLMKFLGIVALTENVYVMSR